MDIWDLVRAERARLADLLEQLTPEQWETPSLCAGWRVRDVVAHLNSVYHLSLGSTLGGLISSGFNFNRWSLKAAREAGSRQTPAQLLAEFRANLDNRKTPPGTNARVMLSDAVTHAGDIRRPLGIPAQGIPPDTLRAVLDQAITVGFPIGTKKRIAGLHLRATDLDWTAGAGPEVRGPAEALILAIQGRRAALDDLEGDGKATLAARA